MDRAGGRRLRRRQSAARAAQLGLRREPVLADHAALPQPAVHRGGEHPGARVRPVGARADRVAGGPGGAGRAARRAHARLRARDGAARADPRLAVPHLPGARARRRHRARARVREVRGARGSAAHAVRDVRGDLGARGARRAAMARAAARREGRRGGGAAHGARRAGGLPPLAAVRAGPAARLRRLGRDASRAGPRSLSGSRGGIRAVGERRVGEPRAVRPRRDGRRAARHVLRGGAELGTAGDQSARAARDGLRLLGAAAARRVPARRRAAARPRARAVPDVLGADRRAGARGRRS